MASAIIETSWGFRRIAESAPHELVHKESDFEVWRRDNGSFMGFALVDGVTQSNIATSHELIHVWLRSIGISPGLVPTTSPTSPVEARGSIRILSNPSNADILLDDAPTGKQTTAVITTTAGSHYTTSFTSPYPFSL